MTAINRRYHLVLLFTDLSDSTRIAARLEPEQYAELLTRLRRVSAEVIARHGGEVVRIDGDGALCIFGYPVAHEDAGRRATEAALDLHEAVAALGLDQDAIRMHSGIHAGVVLLRSGDMISGRYEMLGDATNVAARLCDAAEAGGVLVSEETLGGERHLFRTGALRQVALAGRSAPLRAWPVTGRAAAPTRYTARTRAALTPFAGRDAERAAVAEWLAESSPAPVLAVSGPAGIGKSRLLSQLSAEAEESGWRVRRGYCEAYLGARPLQPFLQIAAGRAAATIPALVEAILVEAEEAPLLLLVDDWQWADDASRELLAQLLARLPARGTTRRLRVLLASREVVEDAPALPLQPLGQDEARSTIARLLRGIDPFALSRIEQASGGSPLLIEELCHAFAAGEATPEADPRGAWFDLAVQSRFAQLGGDDAAFLRLAAVIGHFVPTALLAAVDGSAIDAARLERLAAADFLFPGDTGETLRFKHGLTRDAVYAAIGMAERRALHARLAAALLDAAERSGSDGQVEALARHLAESGQDDAALPWTVRAGDAALAAGALDRAQFHLRAAFALLERAGPDAAALRHVIRAYGRACVVDPEPEHVPVLERMLARAEALGDAEARALATYWTGAHYYGLGESRRSLAALEAARGQVEALGSPSFLAQVQANLGQSCAIAGRYSDALAHMDAAIAAKQAGRDPRRASTSLAYCLSSRGLVRADMGDFAGAWPDFDAALAALAGQDDPMLPSLETQRCLALIYQGHFAEAVARAEWSEERAVAARARFLVLSARALGSYAAWCERSEAQAFDRFVDAALQLHQSRRLQRISYKYGWIVEAMAERGEAGVARKFAALAFARALKGDRLGEASAARGLARLAAQAGSPAPMRRYLAMAGRAARLRQSPREAALNQLAAAQCLTLAGDRAGAAMAAETAASAFAALDMRQWAGELARLRG